MKSPSELALVFDWETTGLTLHPDADVSKQPRAIEFGGVLVSIPSGDIVDEISLLINPGIPITEEITKITGLTDADVANAPRFLAVLPTLRRAFSSAAVCVAHNLPFDRSILRGELARNNIIHFQWPAREVCTVGLYKEQWGKNPRLLELYEAVLGKPLQQTHRALDDVKALVEIMDAERLWEVI